jgi:addiction module HigA family antidote
MTGDPLAPVHPGEILREEFLVPLAMTPYALAKACRVPRTRFERLVNERSPVTPDTALRLARYFRTTGFSISSRPGPAIASSPATST